MSQPPPYSPEQQKMGGSPYPPAGQPGYPPQGGQYPPPQGQPQYAVAPPQQTSQTTTIVAQPMVMGCQHDIREEFTCCGICLAIFFFPEGLICCFLMRERRCTKCGGQF